MQAENVVNFSRDGKETLASQLRCVRGVSEQAGRRLARNHDHVQSFLSAMLASADPVPLGLKSQKLEELYIMLCHGSVSQFVGFPVAIPAHQCLFFALLISFCSPEFSAFCSFATLGLLLASFTRFCRFQLVSLSFPSLPLSFL